MVPQRQPIEILLVEDNPGDVILMQEALKAIKTPHNISFAGDGEEATLFVKKEGSHAKAPTPDIIFLDLNLPKIDGLVVLDFIKKDETLRRIPVIVLTSSNASTDITRAYSLHANSYIVKPMDVQRLMEIVQSIEDFWFGTATLPKK